MKIIVNGSSSKGNNYILLEGDSSIMIEAGIPFKKTINNEYDLKSVKGLLVTHEHGDHIKYANDILASSGFDMYATQGTIEHAIEKNFLSGKATYRYKKIKEKKTTFIDRWGIIPFKSVHDHPQSPVKEPVSFLIKTPSNDLAVFITDTNYCPAKLPEGIKYWLVECNHDTDLVMASNRPHSIKARIVKTHMSIETCKNFFKVNDTSKAERILLLHLSDENSNQEAFRIEIEKITGKKVEIAEDLKRV